MSNRERDNTEKEGSKLRDVEIEREIEAKYHKGWYGNQEGENEAINRSRRPSRDRTARNRELSREEQLAMMVNVLPKNPTKRSVLVFVEGYDDVSFWRGIFDLYESESITFEINVPPRKDLAKGKQVVMDLLPISSPNHLLCVDSDFDYIFSENTEQSKIVNSSKYLFQTYAYASENFLCYAPTLHNICVKATKNDTRIFDFESFLAEYSNIIYPVFLWYVYSGQKPGTEKMFTLLDFKSTVKLNYLEVRNNGRETLRWLERQVEKRLEVLNHRHPELIEKVSRFESHLKHRQITPDRTYLYMQGHTLMDNVVMVMLNAVCEKLRQMSSIRISTSTRKGIALRNEVSNYNNSLRNVRDVLLGNEAYKECDLYMKLRGDIERYIASL